MRKVTLVAVSVAVVGIAFGYLVTRGPDRPSPLHITYDAASSWIRSFEPPLRISGA